MFNKFAGHTSFKEPLKVMGDTKQLLLANWKGVPVLKKNKFNGDYSKILYIGSKSIAQGQNEKDLA